MDYLWKYSKYWEEMELIDVWKKTYLVPIYKNKGGVKECVNFRGLKVMSYTMKVRGKVTEKRLREESIVYQKPVQIYARKDNSGTNILCEIINKKV